MANEITYTGSGGDLRAAEIFNALIWENLVDRTDLRSTLVLLGDVGGSGSDTLTTPTATFNNAMAAANTDETTAAGNTALSSGSVSLSVAHQILAYELSDKFKITAGAGNLGVANLAAQMAQAYIMRVTDLVCSTQEDFTTDVTATAKMDVDSFISAIGTLEQAVVPGPYSAVLHNTQWTELQSSLRSESNSIISYTPATYEQIAIKGPGFVGQLLGVDCFSVDSVTSAASKYNGAMFGLGAIAMVEASPRMSMPGSVAATVTPAGSPVYAEFARTADPGLSKIVGHAFCQVGLLEDSRGCGLLSDA